MSRPSTPTSSSIHPELASLAIVLAARRVTVVVVLAAAPAARPTPARLLSTASTPAVREAPAFAGAGNFAPFEGKLRVFRPLTVSAGPLRPQCGRSCMQPWPWRFGRFGLKQPNSIKSAIPRGCASAGHAASTHRFEALFDVPALAPTKVFQSRDILDHQLRRSPALWRSATTISRRRSRPPCWRTRPAAATCWSRRKPARARPSPMGWRSRTICSAVPSGSSAPPHRSP